MTKAKNTPPADQPEEVETVAAVQPPADWQHKVGDIVTHRNTQERGVIDTIAQNASGIWYWVFTPTGMSIGYWHETDIDNAPKSLPPSTHRAD